MSDPIIRFHRAPTSGPTIITGLRKSLVPATPTPILQVDITQTLIPPDPVPDNSWFGELHFAVEDIDEVGGDVQIRGGSANVAVAFKAPATWNTAQAQNATNAGTAGVVNVAFTWTTAGNIATLNVTATPTVIVPTRLEITYFLLYASHPAFTYL